MYYFTRNQGRPKAPPATQNASQKSSGDKNKEVRGTKFKIVATRCHILRPKCTKFDFGWGSAPYPGGGAHSTPPDPLAGFEGVLLLRGGKGMAGKGRGKGKKRKKGERKGREKGRGKEGRRGGGRKGREEGCVTAFGGWTPCT